MNHFKNRKGTDKLGIALAILGVVVILVFLYFLNNYYSSIKEKMEIQNCKNSLAAHSLLASGSNSQVFTDIKCPTKYITVNANDFTKAKITIGDDMHRCWYEWDRGKGQYFEGDGVFCHICSVYTFKPAGKTINGFTNFLLTEPLPIKYAGDTRGITYSDYFHGYTSPNSEELSKNTKIQDAIKEQYIDTSQKYATIIVYASGKDEIDKMLEGGVAAGVATGGFIAGTLGAAAGTIAIGKIGLAIATVGVAGSFTPIGWITVGIGLTLVGVGAIIIAMDIDEPQVVSFIAFREYNAEQLNSLGCDKSEVNQLSHSTP